MENTGITEQNYHAMSVGEWMITLLISVIPIVNLVMYFVWAFGDNTNQSKANWAKASLIWIAIAFVLYVLFFVIIFSTTNVLDGVNV